MKIILITYIKNLNALDNELRKESFRSPEILVGGLKLLNLPEENIIMVGLMLPSESQIVQMLEWLNLNFKNKVYPTQQQVMDKAMEIMQDKD